MTKRLPLVLALALNIPTFAHGAGVLSLSTNVTITATQPSSLPAQLFPTTGGVLPSPAGNWSFGALSADGVNAPVLLNGVSAQGYVGRVVALANGSVYFRGLTVWWRWDGAGWIESAQPPITPLPSAIRLDSKVGTLPEASPAGTRVADVAILMSVDGAAFGGALSIAPAGFFAISGSRVVTAHALTANDLGVHSASIAAPHGPSADLSLKVVPQGAPQVPAGAAAAGFTTLALNSDFTQQMPAGWLGGCATPGNGQPVNPQYYWDGQPHTWWMNIWWSPVYQGCTVSQVQDPTFGGLVLEMPWTVDNAWTAVGTVIQSGSWDYSGPGHGTVNSYPNNAYYEITARITPAAPGAYFVLHTWPPDAMADQSKGGHELDVIETSGNELWKYDAAIHNWHFGPGGVFLWLGQVPSAAGGLPANYDPSIYHTFGLRVTATGQPSADGRSMGACSYIDNVLVRCVNNTDQGVAIENTTQRQFLVLQNACDWWNHAANGCAHGRDQRLYVKSVRVFSCADWNAAQCNRPVLMGAP